jgi:hypothetical protein
MELKDILTYVGIEAENIGDFKKKFDETYLRKENALDWDKLNAEIGKVKGGIETAIKRQAKAFGVEFQPEELKDKKVEEIIEITLKKITENADAALKAVKEESKKAKPQEVQELLEKLNKLTDKANQYEQINADLKKQMEQKEAEFNNSIKSIKKNLQLENLWGSIKFRSDVDPLQIKGFKADINEKYKFDLNEKEDLVITDLDGKFIPSSAKHGAIKTPAEVITELAAAAKILSVNKDEGRRVWGVQRESQPPAIPSSPLGKNIQISNRALEAAR